MQLTWNTFEKMTKMSSKQKSQNSFSFMMFTMRTNFLNQTKLKQIHLFCFFSEAVTKRDDLHVRFCLPFCFRRSSHASKNLEQVEDNAPHVEDLMWTFTVHLLRAPSTIQCLIDLYASTS